MNYCIVANPEKFALPRDIGLPVDIRPDALWFTYFSGDINKTSYYTSWFAWSGRLISMLYE